MGMPLQPSMFPDIEGPDFVRSEDIAAVAATVLEQHGRVGGVARLHPVARAIDDEEIHVLWLLNAKPWDPEKDEEGHDVAGKCLKAPGIWHDVTGYDVAIWIREYFWQRWEPRIREAAVLHELLHVEVKRDKDNVAKAAIRKHDVEDFVDVVRHYGPIFGEGPSLIRAAALFRGEPAPLAPRQAGSDLAVQCVGQTSGPSPPGPRSSSPASSAAWSGRSTPGDEPHRRPDRLACPAPVGLFDLRLRPRCDRRRRRGPDPDLPDVRRHARDRAAGRRASPPAVLRRDLPEALMRATWRPLAIWPYAPRPKRQSLFKVGWDETLRDLDREVEAASGTDLVIGVVTDDSWIRIDGRPKSGFKVRHPGVEVSFDRPGLGRVAFHTDTYDKVQHNLRAITLGLVALRAVDRQGITSGLEQYAGFQQLTAGGADAELGKRLVDQHGSVALALRAFHPDHSSGREREFASVMAYKNLVRT